MQEGRDAKGGIGKRDIRALQGVTATASKNGLGKVQKRLRKKDSYTPAYHHLVRITI